MRRRPLLRGRTTSSVGPWATARSASRRVIDPPGPVPRKLDASTPPSFKILRTTGDTTTRDEDSGDAVVSDARTGGEGATDSGLVGTVADSGALATSGVFGGAPCAA